MTPPQTPKPLDEKELEEIEGSLKHSTGSDLPGWAAKNGFLLIDEIKRLRAGPSEAQLEEEGPLLMMLDNYEKYLVQLHGDSSSRELDRAFAQFRDLLDEWISNDGPEKADAVKDSQ